MSLILKQHCLQRCHPVLVSTIASLEVPRTPTSPPSVQSIHFHTVLGNFFSKIIGRRTPLWYWSTLIWEDCSYRNRSFKYFIITLWIYQRYLARENNDVVKSKLLSTCYFEFRVRQQPYTDLPTCHESFSGAWKQIWIISSIIQMSNSIRILHLLHC